MSNLIEEIRGRSWAVEGSDKVRRECIESSGKQADLLWLPVPLVFVGAVGAGPAVGTVAVGRGDEEDVGSGGCGAGSAGGGEGGGKVMGGTM